jgi:hypothetical protein
MSLRKLSLGLIFAGLLMTGASAQTIDPLVGNWELNVGASNFGPTPPLKSQTRSYEVTGQQEKMTGKGIDMQGKASVVGFTLNRDGKDYPYEGSPAIDTIALTQVDPLTANYTLKKAGTVVMIGSRVIAADGRTMKVTGKLANGAETLSAFDRH